MYKKFFTNDTSLIIPTRNRAAYLERILKQLKFFKIIFNEILVIDSSDLVQSNKIKEICKYFSVNLYHTYPSTSHQRNLGIKKVKKNSKFIMFLDDDIVFFRDAFKNMNITIKKNENNYKISGFGFNLINKSKLNILEKIKKSKLAKYLNLYSDIPGKIMLNGWQTKISNIKKDTYVEWLYTAASIYKYNDIKKMSFSLSLGSYSYLEDLDFCLNLKKYNKKLLISYNAKFLHPNFIERNDFSFGIVEIVNRFQIVRKHKLNLKYFFISSIIRASISFLGIFKGSFKSINRFLGNIVGIANCIYSLCFN